VKKFLSLALLGVTAATLTLATPALSFAGWHGGRGHYHGYRHYGYRHYGYWGHRYWNGYSCYVAPTYYCPPAPLPCTDNLARICVAVPAAARVWIDGQETAQAGAERNFESPPLVPGKEYTYNVTARWMGPDGKEVSLTRQVDVQANAKVNVDLTQPVS
jgi:uncharacterized protein (TIGR03000 family)